ncbi:MAG: response regulator transcription factor [Bacteroidia bacterium]
MRILIAEDERGIAAFLKEGLEEETYAVDVAPDGLKALDLALLVPYDLMLLDWMMPGLSGLEVCRQVREAGLAVPIIFLTAKDTVPDTVAGLRAGANDYIKKPFSFDELLERIRVQLRPVGGEHERFQTGDLTLDIATHHVHLAGQRIELTPKEFALLEYLLRNKGRVCRRTQILEHVWDIRYDNDGAVIDVYVNFIRKKLRQASDKDYIRTLRGIGYTIDD